MKNRNALSKLAFPVCPPKIKQKSYKKIQRVADPGPPQTQELRVSVRLRERPLHVGANVAVLGLHALNNNNGRGGRRRGRERR